MMVFLFTDFGAADLYVGQVKRVLQHMSAVAVIDLLHEAPAFNLRASAHLLAALTLQIPPDSVTLAVVDPGVGGARDAVVLNADGKWLVGPDNGLLSVVAARARACAHWRITWPAAIWSRRLQRLSRVVSFPQKKPKLSAVLASISAPPILTRSFTSTTMEMH
jgi:S-adenosylmethionine hydrolase